MPDPFGQDIVLSSGYTIFVQPLPPYYRDLIDQQFPLPKYPKRTIELAAGDSVDWPYEPPDEPVDKDHADYELYVRWHSVTEKREQIEKVISLARVDYLLSMCVNVLDGEFEVSDDDWVDRLEAAFTDFQIPKHKGKRYLYFLKHVVIRTTEEMDMIINMSTSPEVTMQGILAALQGFQDNMEKGRPAGRDR